MFPNGLIKKRRDYKRNFAPVNVRSFVFKKDFAKNLPSCRRSGDEGS
jgi:hypothetical protein